MLPEHPHLLHCVVTDCHVSPIACDQLKGEDQAFFIFVSPAKAMGSLKKKTFAEEMAGSTDVLLWEENNPIKYAQQGRNGLTLWENLHLQREVSW